MLDRDEIRIFEEARPDLLGLAYRILGSLTDAEDAVQDTFLKWADADREDLRNPASWLTTVCTRRCLDILRSAHRSRVSYVGAWLPEPVHKSVDDGESHPELAASLKTAFLLVLERLTPRERAAYLLHEIFEVSYPEIAGILDLGEAACRKLVSRAKANVDREKVRHRTPLERQDELLAAFESAVTRGTTRELASLLSNDVRLTADGGGKVPAVRNVLRGKTEVNRFVSKRLREYWSGFRWRAVDINGVRGIVLKHRDAVVAAVSFAYSEAGEVTDIYIVRNPEKLANLGDVAIH